MQAPESSAPRGTILLGAVLLVVGALALAGRALDIDALALGWPLFVIVPGILLFVAALNTGGSAGAALAVPGGIVTMAGLVLAVQSATGLWSTWAYAWALVAPGGVGVGLIAYGLFTDQRDLVRSGLPVAAVGLGLFAAFGLFFEGVTGLNGVTIAGGDTIFAVLLVAIGLILLAGSLLGRRSRTEGSEPQRTSTTR